MKIKKILLAIVALLIIIQFFRIDKQNPVSEAKNDLFAIHTADENIKTMIQNTCYDCHSNQTQYPWYSNVAPVSWFLKNHINEGRKHLNFSDFGTYSAEKQAHKLEECAEEVAYGKMPTGGYPLMHAEANLTLEQRKQLENYFNQLSKSYSKNLSTEPDSESQENEH